MVNKKEILKINTFYLALNKSTSFCAMKHKYRNIQDNHSLNEGS